ncbi:hypothetical protein VP01_4841g1 [Puccinia sorghi]|uniref:Uncharacterized protein n=1 Tax=Puccinia sorghi TaxID=27349 RepID=A0A0L6UME7_9BASI|nr:hypothetical protein VP01_4841g1 [Puccinia sorghi]
MFIYLQISHHISFSISLRVGCCGASIIHTQPLPPFNTNHFTLMLFNTWFFVVYISSNITDFHCNVCTYIMIFIIFIMRSTLTKNCEITMSFGHLIISIQSSKFLKSCAIKFSIWARINMHCINGLFEIKFSNNLTCLLPNIFELMYGGRTNMHFTSFSLKEWFPKFINRGWSMELKWYNKFWDFRVHQTCRNEGVEVFKNHKGHLKLLIISFFDYSSRDRHQNFLRNYLSPLIFLECKSFLAYSTSRNKKKNGFSLISYALHSIFLHGPKNTQKRSCLVLWLFFWIIDIVDLLNFSLLHQEFIMGLSDPVDNLSWVYLFFPIFNRLIYCYILMCLFLKLMFYKLIKFIWRNLLHCFAINCGGSFHIESINIPMLLDGDPRCFGTVTVQSVCTVTVNKSLVESLVENGWSNNRSFLGVSACCVSTLDARKGIPLAKSATKIP